MEGDMALGAYQFAVIGDGSTQGTYNIEATFVVTATDGCGNVVSTEVTYTVLDTPKTLSSGAVDRTVEADGLHNGADLSSWLINHGGAVVDASVTTPTTWTFLLSGLGFVKVNPQSTCQNDYIDVVFQAANSLWSYVDPPCSSFIPALTHENNDESAHPSIALLFAPLAFSSLQMMLSAHTRVLYVRGKKIGTLPSRRVASPLSTQPRRTSAPRPQAFSAARPTVSTRGWRRTEAL